MEVGDGLFVGDGILGNGKKDMCGVCHEKHSQYTCPRCSMHYCSVPCYKSHSLSCTEEFYKEEVQNSLQSTTADYHAKKSIEQALQQHHIDMEEESRALLMQPETLLREESVADTEDDVDNELIHIFGSLFPPHVCKALGNCANIEDAVEYLSSLSLEDSAKFIHAAQSGELAGLVEVWQPWWEEGKSLLDGRGRDGSAIVEITQEGYGRAENEGEEREDGDGCGGIDWEANQHQAKWAGELNGSVETKGEGEGSDRFAKSLPPPIPSSIPPFSSLYSAEKPSPSLGLNCVDILMAYVETIRLYNGVMKDDGTSACTELYLKSAVLSENKVFLHSVDEVVQERRSIGQRKGGGGEKVLGNRDVQDLLLTLEDCKAILGRKRFVLSALADTQCLIDTVLEEMKRMKKKKNGGDDITSVGEKKNSLSRSVKASPSSSSSSTSTSLNATTTPTSGDLFLSKQKLFSASKKLTFYLSWVMEQPPTVFERIAIQIMVEHGKWCEFRDREKGRGSKQGDGGDYSVSTGSFGTRPLKNVRIPIRR